MRLMFFGLASALLLSTGALALDRPWISDVYFYWYSWDRQQETGGWHGGVWNKPLQGYYDSSTYEDNLRSLHCASEWGLTHHFMDYWGPGWKGEDGGPREAVVMRAAEALQEAGYDIHMGFYQDGQDFEMREFVRNLDPKRHCRFWVENYASSPVFPRLGDLPFSLIYGRNGRPELSEDQTAYRDYLREKYQTLRALNARWGTKYDNWEDIKIDYADGVERADAIRFQYAQWQAAWAKVDRRMPQEFGLPGLRVSFDVAYQPFRGFGYSLFAKTFAGPHSYGGIFGQPDDQDVQRFIQAAVAKKYDTVFFDHFKNMYADPNTTGRIPGTLYPPEPLHFDRFWVGALCRYSEALLHLSWNEWWEGSNLEPSVEYGKTFCEKNQLYSTILQQCFPAVQQWNRGAKVAVLLNDWLWLSGGRHPEDVYGVVQSLRRANILFDLLPDDFVSAESLDNFEVVIAPTGGAGLGENAAGESIAALVRDWLDSGAKGERPPRKLVVSALPEYWQWLGLSEGPPADLGKAKPGKDMSVFVDVGEPGDEKFLLEGMSAREDWGKLPEGAFGATTGKHTCRWLPGGGKRTVLVLPLSPHRDHVLRLAGSALRPNSAQVLIDGVPAGELNIVAGYHEYELPISAEVVGDRRMGEVTLVYEQSIVPTKVDPEKYGTDSRTCNLSVTWLQLCTANLPRSAEQNYELPGSFVQFNKTAPGKLRGRKVETGYQRFPRLNAGPAEVMSRYHPQQIPRDIVVKRGGNFVWYVNGLVGAQDGVFVAPIVETWARMAPRRTARGDHAMATILDAADRTRIVVAFNEDIENLAHVKIALPVGASQVAEAKALIHDGARDRKLEARKKGPTLHLEDAIRYCGVYQITLGPIKVQTPKLVLHPGETQAVRVKLENLDKRPCSGTLTLTTFVPSIKAEPVEFHVGARGTTPVMLEVSARPDADWGTRAVIFDVESAGRHACFWRQLVIERNPQPRVRTSIVDAGRPRVQIENRENGYAANAPLRGAVLHFEDGAQRVPELPSGDTRRVQLPGRFVPRDRPATRPGLLRLEWDEWGRPKAVVAPILVAEYPTEYDELPGALCPVAVFTPRAMERRNDLVFLDASGVRKPDDAPARVLGCIDDDGQTLLTQYDERTKTLLAVATLPARGCRQLYFALPEKPAPPTDLTVESVDLGTGYGKITVRNSFLEVQLDEASGGTVTRLVARETGRDYGAQSCGVAYGSWGHFSALKPRTDTASYIGAETKTRQRDSAGKLELLESGPVRTIIRATWRDAHLHAEQLYTFYAFQKYFELDTSVRPDKEPADVDEIVLLDLRLKRNELTKIYPGFSGSVQNFKQEKSHFGWRQSRHIPRVATCFTPPKNEESLSLIIGETPGCTGWRQGFWPAQRPEPGPIEFADLEVTTNRWRPAEAHVWVYLHQGNQAAAQRFADELETPPVPIVPRRWRWRVTPK